MNSPNTTTADLLAVLQRMHVQRHYYCDDGPHDGQESVEIRGYLSQEQWALLRSVVTTGRLP